MGYYVPDLQIEFCRSFRWISFTSFCRVLRDLCIVNFDGKHTLKAARKDLIQALSSDIPFSSNTRFPEDGKYVCVDKPQLLGQMVQVLRVLATPDSLLTEAAIKDYFSAIVRMREMIHESEEHVVFSRETFECEFHLSWSKKPINHYKNLTLGRVSTVTITVDTRQISHVYTIHVARGMRITVGRV
jgi:hypothetical protein